MNLCLDVSPVIILGNHLVVYTCEPGLLSSSFLKNQPEAESLSAVALKISPHRKTANALVSLSSRLDAEILCMKLEMLTRSQRHTRLSDEPLLSPRHGHRTFHLLSRSL